MKARPTLLAACVVFSSLNAHAQSSKAPAKSPEAIYSWCVTRFDGGGQKEVFVSSIANSADTVSIKRYVEYHARTGANSSISKDADLSTDCGSSRDKADAQKKRDLKRAESTNIGYLLKPEIVYY
jgi:hypothetical protein